MTHSKSKITFKGESFVMHYKKVKKKAQSKSKFYIKTNLFISAHFQVKYKVKKKKNPKTYSLKNTFQLLF